MNDLTEKQQQRAVYDRIADLKNELYKLDVTHTNDGRSIEDVSLFTLEHTHITAKCRLGILVGEEE